MGLCGGLRARYGGDRHPTPDAIAAPATEAGAEPSPESLRVQQFAQSLGESSEHLFPIPMPPLPSRPTSMGSRSRARYRQQLDLWHLTNRYISALNKLYYGILPPHRVKASQLPRSWDYVTDAQKRVVELAFQRRRPLSGVRRGSPTGARSCTTLLKTAPTECYSPLK